MDWFSRYILSWELSITLEKEFCIDALNCALLISKPEVFNSDQGPQFTSEDFIDVLKKEYIRISMAGFMKTLQLSRVICFYFYFYLFFSSKNRLRIYFVILAQKPIPRMHVYDVIAA